VGIPNWNNILDISEGAVGDFSLWYVVRRGFLGEILI